MKFSAKFWVGIALLASNQPFGWLAIIVCNSMAISRHSAFYSFLGVYLYLFSWVMVGVGLLLSGREGMEYSRRLLKRGWVRLSVFMKDRIV